MTATLRRIAEFDALNDTGTESLEGGKIVEVLLRAGVPNETSLAAMRSI